MLHRGTRKFLGYFVRAYPKRTGALTLLLIASGFFEGVGFFSLLPLLELAAQDETAELSGLTAAMGEALGAVGLPLTLGTVLLVISAAMVFKAAFLWLAMRQVGYAMAQVATDLRMRLIRALLRAPWSHFVSQPAGHFAAAISHEAHKASSAYRQACTALAGLIRMSMYLGVAVLVSWQVAAMALFVAAALLYVLRGFIQMSREAGRHQVTVMRSLIARLTELLPGIKPIKAMSLERLLLPLLEKETEGFNKAQQRQVLATESLGAFQEPVLVIVLAVGLYVVITFTNQPLSAVLVLAVVFHRMVTTANKLQKQYQLVAVGEDAFESIWSHIQLAESRAEISTGGARQAPDLEQSIDLEAVSFAYEDSPVLHDVNLSIPAGSFTALIGPSGSGKTTIVDLIVGLHRPDVGRILVDGIPLDEIELRAWRSRIGYVPQEMILFRGSVFDNLTLGDEDVDEEAAQRALEQAEAWEFIEAHSLGMHMPVGEGGGMLSGGQRQRISIARALVRSPQLLILDEPTTALDSKTEAEVCATLANLSGQVTVVAVSHQPALRDVADQVYEIDRGRATLFEKAAL